MRGRMFALNARARERVMTRARANARAGDADDKIEPGLARWA